MWRCTRLLYFRPYLFLYEHCKLKGYRKMYIGIYRPQTSLRYFIFCWKPRFDSEIPRQRATSCGQLQGLHFCDKNDLRNIHIFDAKRHLWTRNRGCLTVISVPEVSKIFKILTIFNLLVLQLFTPK